MHHQTKKKDRVMEKRTLENVTEKISKIVKEKGVNGYYVYLENGVKLTDGTIVNEVRVNSEDKVECLEKGTNKVLRYVSKENQKKLLLALKNNG